MAHPDNKQVHTGSWVVVIQDGLVGLLVQLDGGLGSWFKVGELLGLESGGTHQLADYNDTFPATALRSQCDRTGKFFLTLTVDDETLATVELKHTKWHLRHRFWSQRFCWVMDCIDINRVEHGKKITTSIFGSATTDQLIPWFIN